MICFSGVDHSSNLRRGKVASMLLPQSEMMEQFIANLSVKHPSWRTTQRKMLVTVKEVSVCTWDGITCNGREEIVRLTYKGDKLRLVGTLQWKCLPQTILTLRLVSNGISGEVKWDNLPVQMVSLSLVNNQFSGTLQLECLPRDIVCIFLSENRFSGELAFENLPSSLQQLYLCGNQDLHGVVDIKALPSTLEAYDFRRTLIVVCNGDSFR
mmetsp:Transcript_40210/g.55925  ORF Transcript_40210/g.55925 Transcript_40210/m.55925 type:complete len:211 (-) Transcript_40210:24-656(-)